MTWLPLAFSSPLILFALFALPAIWWLLRMTPPRPQEEIFPPLKILAQLIKREEVPSQSPWWLTLLRMLIAGLVILALASPIWNPRPVALTGNEPVVIVLDNSWAAAATWQERTEAAERLISDARDVNAPIYLLATAEPANAEIGPFDANDAINRLQALQPRSIPSDRKAGIDRLLNALPTEAKVRLAILGDGIAQPNDDAVFTALDKSGHVISTLWYNNSLDSVIAFTNVENKADSLEVTAIRPDAVTSPRRYTAAAYDNRGRRIGEAQLNFALGQPQAVARFTVPVELRNDFHAIRLDGINQAGATYLIDAGSERRTIGLLAIGDGDKSQPLLSPLHYISRALSPYANLIEPRSTELLQSVPELLQAKPSIMVMADIGTLPKPVEEGLQKWIEQGGTLVRFAGPRLAGAAENDPFLPIQLRKGERSLGGSLSWSEPQKLRAFTKESPFAGLSVPDDVTVTRQVLAEPSIDLNDKTYAVLQDGTPLVTGERRGNGNIILFHTSPDASWSNLPISGTFIEMLRRIIALSNRTNSTQQNADATLPPFQILAADGKLTPPTPEAKPLVLAAGTQPSVTLNSPPGFYGNEDGLKALNIFASGAELRAQRQPTMSTPISTANYSDDNSIELRGLFFAIAAILLALDALLVLWIQGMFRRFPRAGQKAAVGIIALGLGAGFAFAPVNVIDANAQQPNTAADAKPTDQKLIDSVSKTRLAYVITGKEETDRISEAGLRGLSFALIDKTALEPGDPIGVDLAKDDLAFYPILYWPIDADAPMPSDEAIAKADAYMQHGGTILFDTRDQLSISASNLDASTSPANQRLRAILDGMNIPPLEPVPDDHVLTKTFYIMRDFPGRYEGSPLWVAASSPSTAPRNRPVRVGDGVTPIMITANDLAGAWAVDSQGTAMLPTVPNDPMQRVYAERGGINIIMYMLTGNYKSDQVHVRDLLERLGN